MEQPAATALYYWQNYQFLLGWVRSRYEDILSDEERAFVVQFDALPQPAQALLVRMLMRKGLLFRHSKLVYPEIGDTALAIEPLIACGWILANPDIPVEDLWRQLLKTELHQQLQVPKACSKANALDWLLSELPATAHWDSSVPGLSDALYQLQIQDISDLFRLMFFGNAYQELTEFVVADLGIMRYETVPFPDEARAFKNRHELAVYRQIHQCTLLLDDKDWDACRDQLPEPQPQNVWLQRRRDKLCYRLAYQLERSGDLGGAMTLYQNTHYPGSHIRQIRILMAQEAFEPAWDLWQTAVAEVQVEADMQALERMGPRLAKKVGANFHVEKADIPTEMIETVPLESGESVEVRAAQLIATPRNPVYFMENSLINGLFGLWCWPALFAPVQGAFFHPYQLAPADLHHPDFVARRADIFGSLWQQFEQQGQQDKYAKANRDTQGKKHNKDNKPSHPALHYAEAIRQRYSEKQGIANPFVNWNLLTPELLELGLTCLPADWLQALFRRLLSDIRANRSGFPDLVQFHLDQQTATFIEVKGPGDTLQDNQRRWMAEFARIGIPHRVSHVRW
jgi:hypothetical protein